LPRYDYICLKCKTIKEFSCSIADREKGDANKEFVCPNDSEVMIQYFGNYSPHKFTGEEKFIDLMHKDSFAHEHERPKAWFAEQTRLKQEANAARERDRHAKNGTLKTENVRRKSLGLPPL
jgi:hypothetical protein